LFQKAQQGRKKEKINPEIKREVDQRLACQAILNACMSKYGRDADPTASSGIEVKFGS
jgi:hypothetical protein